MSLRFVILHHTGIASPHFDLMFETAPDSALTTFRSDHWPIEAPTVLTRIGDHRRVYLDYEGPLTQNRGTVTRVASGTYQLERRDADTFWTIRPDAPASPRLHLKLREGDQWLALPACG